MLAWASGGIRRSCAASFMSGTPERLAVHQHVRQAPGKVIHEAWMCCVLIVMRTTPLMVRADGVIEGGCIYCRARARAACTRHRSPAQGQQCCRSCALANTGEPTRNDRAAVVITTSARAVGRAHAQSLPLGVVPDAPDTVRVPSCVAEGSINDARCTRYFCSERCPAMRWMWHANEKPRSMSQGHRPEPKIRGMQTVTENAIAIKIRPVPHLEAARMDPARMGSSRSLASDVL